MPQRLDLPVQRRPVQGGHPLTEHHHQVHCGQPPAPAPERFAHQAFDEIPVRCPGEMTFADDDAEPGHRRAYAKQQKGRHVHLVLTLFEHAFEFLLAQQAGSARKALVDQGVSRFRPLARRRASTCRPERVAMRARKPWVRLRLMTLG